MRYSRVAMATAVVLMNFTLYAYQNGDGRSTAAAAATAAVNNVQPVVVDYGPTTSGHLAPYPNALFTTVTVCVPGTSTCQSIDHILVDTGSVGLRLLSSQLTLTLPYSKDTSTNLIGNCVQYANLSYQWGPVAKADVKMAGEVASSIPIQIVGAANFPAAPYDCDYGGYLFPAQDVSELGANGILGVGLFRQDCGDLCSRDTPSIPAYWSCRSSACTIASTDLSAQLQNPVWMFPQDNNGLSIILPQVIATGSPSLTGSMIFGIGTQSNNALNGAVAMATDRSGTFTTTFNGKAYPGSFIDSGSNGYYFLDSSSIGLPDCTGIFAGFYCPPGPTNFLAVNSGPNPSGSGVPVSVNVPFYISNGAALLGSVLPTGMNVPETAFNDLGAGGFFSAFDWGLPFFFGRTVFVGIDGQSSSAGTGPYMATLSPDCSYQVDVDGAVDAGGQAFSSAGGTGTISITAPPGCEWTVDAHSPLIGVGPASGIGNGALTFSVGNNRGSDWSGSFTIEGQTVNVEQEANAIAGLNFIGSMAHLAAEENWTTMFTLVNKSAVQAQARVSFFPTIFDSSFDGTLQLPVTFPQLVPAAGPLLGPTFDRALAANASLIFDTAGPQTPPVLLGSARLSATGAVDGFAIFHQTQTQQEAVVPLETRNASSYLLAFDNTGGAVLGVAIANLSAQDINIPVVIRDDTGAVISNPGATILVRANYQTSFVLSDPAQGFLVTADKRGTVEFDTPAGARISVLGLRFSPPNNALTTIPALANVGTGGGSIAHLASGGDGWQTTFVLVNTGTGATSATLNFFDDQTGAPLTLPLSFPQSSATDIAVPSYTQTLAAGATLVIVSSGAPQLLTGSAQLRTAGNVSGFVIFRHNDQEAVVPLESRNANGYVLAFDNTKGTSTGVALNAVSAQQVNVPVTVRDEAGTQIETDTIALVANGHAAFTLGSDKYPATANIRGTIEFGKPANGQIGVLGIRIPVAHTFTTLPALAK
jgi:hypothetical protein